MVVIIDNKNITLLEYTNKLFKKSKQVKVASGYFFLSGWNTIKDKLPTNPPDNYMRIIIGDETTQTTVKALTTAHLKLKSQIVEHVTEANNTEELKKLYELLKNNKLTIRIYTKGKLHAKLYLFLNHPEELTTTHGTSPGVAIVGSSNLTKPGFTTNKELNIALTDREAILDLNKWFEELWDESEDFKEELMKIIDVHVKVNKDVDGQAILLGKLITPRELFKILVWRLFDGRIEPIQKKDVLAEFQHIGVINAIDIINKYNGVIVADSVGLGKSFVGATIIEEYIRGRIQQWNPEHYGFKKERKALLVLPPSLIPQWEHLLFKSGYFFTGGIKTKFKTHPKYLDKYKIYEVWHKTDKGHVKLGEVGLLSLGIFSNLNEKDIKRLGLNYEYDLILIDEAHKFRNRQTKRWKNARLLRFKQSSKKAKTYQNKFILLTATPLNNTIWDIYNLIKLFSDDRFTPFKQRGTNVTQLFQEFREVKRKWKKNPKNIGELKMKAQEIKEKILDEVMILRTRRYIRETFGKGDTIKVGDKVLSFKEPEPEAIEYTDTAYYKEYEQVIKTLGTLTEKLHFTYTKLYTSGYVVIGNSTSSLYEEKPEDTEREFIRVPLDTVLKILLAKRLESSIYAFEKTLDSMLHKNEAFYKTLKKFKHMINNSPPNQTITILDKLGNELLKIAGKEDIEKIVNEEDMTLEEQNNNDNKTQNTSPKMRMLTNFLIKGLEKEQNNQIQLPQILTTTQFYKLIQEKPELVKLIISGITEFEKELEKDFTTMTKIKQTLNKLKIVDTQGKPIIAGFITEDDGKHPIYVYKDPKLEKLKNIIYNDVRGMKYIIFTQYKDTAMYLHNNLLPWLKHQKHTLSYLFDTKRNRLKVGLVTGDLSVDEKEKIIKQFAPEANDGWTEVEKHGEIMVLISTDSLSEGVNLQDADGVINYDLPWNPMVIVQRVGRVSRIGSTKDVFVKNFAPAQEIDMTLGLMAKLQEKIRDITLLVGKEFYIISSDEEITIETFGEKLKSLAELKLSQLEETSMSEDFKFMKGGMPDEVLAKFELLDYIQNKLKLRKEDFEDVKPLINSNKPLYTIIGNKHMIAFTEYYMGETKIGTKLFMYTNGQAKEAHYNELIKLWEAGNTIHNNINYAHITKKYTTLYNIIKNQKPFNSELKQKGFFGKLSYWIEENALQSSLINNTQNVSENDIKKAITYLDWAEAMSQDVSKLKKHLIKIGALKRKGKKVEPTTLELVVKGVIEFFEKDEILKSTVKDLKFKVIGWWC